MTRNGKLVAYSSPFAIAQMQAEAALVSMAWKANASSSSPSKAPLSSLTIEANDYNVVACPIQNNLLLVLNGTKKDDGTSSFKITPTLADSAEDLEDDSHLEEDVVALTARGSSSPRLHALTLQRRKVQRIAKTVEAEAQFLRIPDDSPYG